MLRRLHPGIAVASIVLSAFATALAFPPWNLRPLAFVCLVPLLLALRSGGLVRAVVLAGLWCVLFATAIASVLPVSVARYYEQPLWFGFLVAGLAFLGMAAVYYMAFAAVDRWLIRRVHVATPLLVAAAWTVAELGRGRLLTETPFFIGNPWGLIGYTHASGALAQTASWAGVYGIGFAIVAVDAGLAGVIGAPRGSGAAATAWRGLGLAVLPAILFAGWGAAVLHAAPPPGETAGTVPIAIVQGDVSIERRWRADFHAKNLDVYLGLTRIALEAGAAEGAAPVLVLWPESAMNFFLETEPRYRDAIEATLAGSGAMLLAGGPGRGGIDGSAYLNSVFGLRAGSSELARYDKEYLIPFSEYFPGSSLDWMRRRIEGVRTFTAGPGRPPPIETPAGRAGLLVCNEAMLPEVARARVLDGAELLVNPSNDSWIRGRAFAEHMLAVVGLRAVEQRRYLVRASTAGPSAVVDPWGRVGARSAAGERTIVRGRVAPMGITSFYGRFGDAFASLCVVAVLVGCVLARRTPVGPRPARSGELPRRSASSM